MEISSLVYIGLTVITLVLAYFVDNREYAYSTCRPSFTDRTLFRNRVAMFAIFVLLTGVSACRIAVGNDYWVYRFNFRLIAQERHVSSEAGFNAIVRGMQDLFGYDNYLPIFALFSFLTVLFFMLALRDQGQYYLFSVFLLLTGGYYFNSLNSVRYYLALAIALYSMKFVLRGDYLRFLFWILVGVNFHMSILLAIPVYLIAKLLSKIRIRPWMWAAVVLFLLSLIFLQDVYRRIFFFFYPYYEGSAFDNGNISWVNLAKVGAVLVLCAICYRSVLQEDRVLKFYFFLNLIGFVVYCCGSFLPESSRIGYYLIISQIFLLPGLLAKLKEGLFRNLCYIGVISAFTAYFAFELIKMYDVNIRLLPYRNWIFQ